MKRHEYLSEAIPSHRRTFWGLSGAARDLWEERSLLNLLVKRDIKARYKDSALGLLWSLFKPITQLLIFYVVVGKFLGAERSIANFPVFVFTGLTAWALVSEVITGSTTSILSNAGLVKKVYLPRELFPLASTGFAIFNFGIQFAVLIVFTLVTGAIPNLGAFFYVPVGFTILLFTSLGIGLFTSAASVYLRDIQHLVEVLLILFFWTIPIVYSYEFVSKALGPGILLEIYSWNPITIGIMAFQKGMWVDGTSASWPDDLGIRMIVSLAVSLIVLLLGQRIFSKLEGDFAQEL